MDPSPDTGRGGGDLEPETHPLHIDLLPCPCRTPGSSFSPSVEASLNSPNSVIAPSQPTSPCGCTITKAFFNRRKASLTVLSRKGLKHNYSNTTILFTPFEHFVLGASMATHHLEGSSRCSGYSKYLPVRARRYTVSPASFPFESSDSKMRCLSGYLTA